MVYFHGKAYDTETLNGMTSGQLVALYNMLVAAKGSSKPVTRFESHAKGVIRVWNALHAEVVVADAIENPDTTIDRGADPITDVPALDDDGITVTTAIAELKEKSAELGKKIKQVKKAAADVTKSISKIDRLLEILRSNEGLGGVHINDLALHMDVDAKRVRGLIDSARSKHGKAIIVNKGKGVFTYGGQE